MSSPGQSADHSPDSAASPERMTSDSFEAEVGQESFKGKRVAAAHIVSGR